MQNLIATTFEVVHYIALQAVHYKPLQEVHLSRYNQLRASPQQYDQPDERKVDEIKENFTFAEHCNLDAEITALLMRKAL